MFFILKALIINVFYNLIYKFNVFIMNTFGFIIYEFKLFINLIIDKLIFYKFLIKYFRFDLSIDFIGSYNNN